MKEFTIAFGQAWQRTIFCRSEDAIFLKSLCGLPCGLNGQESGPKSTRGLFVMDTLDRHYQAERLRLIDCQVESDAIRLSFLAGETGLKLTSRWMWDGLNGIWSRRDRIENHGLEPRVLTRCLARFSLAPDHYIHVTQSGSWSHENQMHANVFYLGRLSLGSQGGRTTQGASPYLFTTAESTGRSLAFHLIPCGDWVMHIDQTRSAGNERDTFSGVEMGLDDFFLRLRLEPGAGLDLPEILIQAVAGSDPKDGAGALQTYALGKFFGSQRQPPVKKSLPVVYNTWFDAFECLDVPRLRRQLAAAAAAGCEIFCVDAGWFGAGQGSWHQQVGDWREKPDGAFYGGMNAFAAEVRAAGLGFGLWVEPERYARSAPAVRDHPEWFLAGDGGFFSPDLSRVDAYAYVFAELERLIETYQLAWMKVDFNFELGLSPDAHNRYYARWYALLDELRLAHPAVIFEGCASGGMRADLNSLAHFDAHFLSDSVNPFDSMRITQAAALRQPLGRMTKWAVLRSIQQAAPRYGLPAEQAPERVITPAGADWGSAFVADLDFCYRATLPGVPGLSGDLASLSEQQIKRLRQLNQFTRDWREWMSDAVCEPLTPLHSQDDRRGWVAFHLYQADQGASLLLVYRLDDGRSSMQFPIRHVDPARHFRIYDSDAPDGPYAQLDGKELRGDGALARLPEKNSARVYILRPVENALDG